MLFQKFQVKIINPVLLFDLILCINLPIIIIDSADTCMDTDY